MSIEQGDGDHIRCIILETLQELFDRSHEWKVKAAVHGKLNEGMALQCALTDMLKEKDGR